MTAFWKTSMRALGAMALSALLASALAFPAAAKNSAVAARTGIQSGNVSRFVLETLAPPEYSIFYLDNPQRIVVDVQNLGFSNMKREAPASGFISNVRTGALDAKISRFVLDLAKAAKVKSHFVLRPISGNRNHRLVVDVEAAGNDEFADIAKKNLTHVSTGFMAMAKNGTDEEEIVSTGAPGTIRPSTSDAVKLRPASKPPASAAKSGAEKTNRPKIIVIDPGHGGQDPGAIGKGGTKEKDIVLSMARQLRDILKRNSEYTVLMTRETDIFIPLRERAEFAEKRNASLFVSVHADSSPKKTTKGFSVYTLSERATDEESKKIAEKENAADLLGVGTLSGYDDVTRSILGDLLQAQVKIASAELANEMVRQVSQDLLCVENPHREAPFTVLRSAIPSVLIETGFLSNAEEEKKLKQKWYRDKLAYSLARAVDAILKE
ncbi:MAG: N-acetylmuramoyl-L-alanine amidase [Rickettsiales bacterium]|nr:N-acetylmuramoyl-L-alanine amidase [Rickettsiales bacterium]